jgi:hypothetical protein
MPSLNSVCLREVLFLLFFLRARDPKPFTCFSHFICNLSYMILNMVICNFLSATERRPHQEMVKILCFSPKHGTIHSAAKAGGLVDEQGAPAARWVWASVAQSGRPTESSSAKVSLDCESPYE